MRIVTTRAVLAATCVALAAASSVSAGFASAAPNAAPTALVASSVAPAAAPAAVVAAAGSGAFMAVVPARIADTRTGLGAPKRSVAGGHSITVQVAGRGGLPLTGMSAVALTVTALAPNGAGAVVVYPAGGAVPSSTNVEFSRGRPASDLVLVAAGHAGKVTVRVEGPGHAELAVDVDGYVLSGGSVKPGGIRALPAKRIVGTASGVGVPKKAVTGGHSITVQLAGRGGLPTSGMSAVALTVSALSPTGSGGVAVYPTGGAVPAATNVSFSRGRAASGLVLVRPGSGGRVTVRVDGSGHVQLAVDVDGYVRSGASLQPGGLHPVAPSDVLKASSGAVSTRHPVTLTLAGRGGVPASGAAAVALAVTVSGATSAGGVQAVPATSDPAGTTDLQFTRGHTESGLMLVHLSESGTATLRLAGSAHARLAASVVGYVSTTSTLSWHSPKSVDPPHAGVPGALSCTSPTSCTAVDFDSAIRLTSNGWSSPTEIAPNPVGNGLGAVSCVGTTFCAALGYNGQSDPFSTYAVVLKGGKWTSTDVSSFGAGPVAISCVTAADCWGIDDNATLYNYDGSSWTSSTPLASGGGMLGISCPTTLFCAAVGISGQVATYNGSSWTTVSSINSDDLYRVSCTSSTFCIAVSTTGNAYEYNGATWGSAVALTTSTLNSVSCASATTTCVAVDNDGSSYSFNGSSWSAATTIDAGDQILAVSCSTSTDCEAVDIDNLAHRWNGTTWANPVTMDYSQGTPDGVSCWAAGHCVASDETGNALTLDGTTWRRHTLANVNYPLRLPSCTSASFCLVMDLDRTVLRFTSSGAIASTRNALSDDLFVQAMTCTSSSFCIAMDAYHTYATYNGSKWSAEKHYTETTGSTGFIGQVVGISCTSPTYCVAVSTSGQALTFNGKKWNAPVRVTLDGLFHVSCVGTGFCVAISSDNHGFVLDDGKWRPSTIGGPRRSLAAVSCSAVNSCVALDGAGGAYQFDGVVWTPRVVIDTETASLEGLDCTSTTFCLAISASGDAITGR